MILSRVWVRACVVLLLAAYLTACSSTKGQCYKVREYQLAEDAPRVTIPEGLRPLDDRLRMVIPEGERNKSATPQSEPCLDYPPRYFREALPGEQNEEKT